MDDVWGALPVIETTVEVVDMAPEMPTEPYTTEFLPEGGIETMASLL